MASPTSAASSPNPLPPWHSTIGIEVKTRGTAVCDQCKDKYKWDTTGPFSVTPCHRHICHRCDVQSNLLWPHLTGCTERACIKWRHKYRHSEGDSSVYTPSPQEESPSSVVDMPSSQSLKTANKNTPSSQRSGSLSVLPAKSVAPQRPPKMEPFSSWIKNASNVGAGPKKPRSLLSAADEGAPDALGSDQPVDDNQSEEAYDKVISDLIGGDKPMTFAKMLESPRRFDLVMALSQVHSSLLLDGYKQAEDAAGTTIRALRRNAGDATSQRTHHDDKSTSVENSQTPAPKRQAPPMSRRGRKAPRRDTAARPALDENYDEEEAETVHVRPMHAHRSTAPEEQGKSTPPPTLASTHMLSHSTPRSRPNAPTRRRSNSDGIRSVPQLSPTRPLAPPSRETAENSQMPWGVYFGSSAPGNGRGTNRQRDSRGPGSPRHGASQEIRAFNYDRQPYSSEDPAGNTRHYDQYR